MAEQKPKLPLSDFVARVVKDPKSHTETMVLTGFLGASSEEGHTRLYYDESLGDYVEIPNDGILHAVEMEREQSPLGGVYVWVKGDAQCVHGRAGGQRVKQSFFGGEITDEFMGGATTAGPTGTFVTPTIQTLRPTTFCPSVLTACVSRPVWRCPPITIRNCPTINPRCPETPWTQTPITTTPVTPTPTPQFGTQQFGAQTFAGTADAFAAGGDPFATDFNLGAVAGTPTILRRSLLSPCITQNSICQFTRQVWCRVTRFPICLQQTPTIPRTPTPTPTPQWGQFGQAGLSGAEGWDAWGGGAEGADPYGGYDPYGYDAYGGGYEDYGYDPYGQDWTGAGGAMPQGPIGTGFGPVTITIRTLLTSCPTRQWWCRRTALCPIFQTAACPIPTPTPTPTPTTPFGGGITPTVAGGGFGAGLADAGAAGAAPSANAAVPPLGTAFPPQCFPQTLTAPFCRSLPIWRCPTRFRPLCPPVTLSHAGCPPITRTFICPPTQLCPF